MTDQPPACPLAEIDVYALRRNWQRFVELAAPGVAAAVVKADAYGLGVGNIVPILARSGCRRWYVATVLEAVALRRLTGPDAAISVLNGPVTDSIALYDEYALTPVLNSLEQIALWKRYGSQRSDVAIHLDTGMNRLGLNEEDWHEASQSICRPSMLISHLACAWTPDHRMNAIQERRFGMARSLFDGVPTSFANSAGAFLGNRPGCDEIRVGIGLYGVGPDMIPAVRFSAPVLQVRRLGAGSSTGYDQLYTATEDMDIACLGAGYADGVLQSVSCAGYGFVHSERRPLLGRVSMDSAMIDVHGLTPRVQAGDMVELYGPNLPVGEQAAALGVSEYMLLTGLGPRVSRVVSEQVRA